MMVNCIQIPHIVLLYQNKLQYIVFQCQKPTKNHKKSSIPIMSVQVENYSFIMYNEFCRLVFVRKNYCFVDEEW